MLGESCHSIATPRESAYCECIQIEDLGVGSSSSPGASHLVGSKDLVLGVRNGSRVVV